MLTSGAEYFAKARTKARMQKLLTTLQWKHPDLLSLYEVTTLIKPCSETYRGIVPIPVDQIIGSEGRYHDFTLAFYPKKELLRQRWLSIHNAQARDIILPPISVYKLGDAYFVRDGNHRVSVARSNGVEFIDAEVVELDSMIMLRPGMTMRQIRRTVVEWERGQFIDQYNPQTFMDIERVRFTTPGMYAELINHILVHKYYLNEDQVEEIPFEVAGRSWYENVYLPIAEQIRSERLLVSFPGKSVGDLYMWIVRHWDNLKSKGGKGVTIKSALKDYQLTFGKGTFRRWIDWFKEIFSRS